MKSSLDAKRVFLKLSLCIAISPAIGQESGAGFLEEVVVTAQKRAENIQDVPVAITNISGDVIAEADIRDISGLTAVAPSLNFTEGSSGRNSSLRIRGLGTDSFNVGIEPSVSIVVDGVVQARPAAAFANLADIERIEVLRGPQGTLFGKNSSVGALNVVTKAPNLEEFEARIDLSVAENAEYNGAVMLSGPISDSLAYRVNGFYREREGLIDNLFTGGTVGDLENKGFSGKLLWVPSDTLQVVFSADTYSRDSVCCGNTLRIDGVDRNATTQISSGDYTGVVPGFTNTEVSLDRSIFTAQEQDSFSVTVDWELGEHTLTSISAYSDFSFDGESDRDASQAQLQWSRNYTENEVFTQEIRLTSPAYERFDYVAGLFYFDSSVNRGNNFSGWRDNDPDDVLPDGTLINPGPIRGNRFDASVDIVNYAAFGQLNYRLTDSLMLIGGLRALREEQDFSYEDVTTATRRVNSNAIPLVTDSLSDTEVIGRLGLRYEISDYTNAYVTYATGYKGPAYRAQNALQPEQVAAGDLSLDAETSDSLEFGLKSELFNNRLRLNAALYRVEFDGFQAQAPDLVNGGNINQNIGTVVLQGLEVEFEAAPTDNLTLSGGFTVSDNEIDKGFAGCFPGQSEEEGCVDGVQDLAAVDGQLQNAPELRYTLRARYEFGFGEKYRPFVLANYVWQDDILFALTQDPNTVQEAYGLLDLTLGLQSEDDKYRVTLFGKNILDEQFVGSISTGPGNAGTQSDYFQAIPRNFNRYFGVSLSVNF